MGLINSTQELAWLTNQLSKHGRKIDISCTVFNHIYSAKHYAREATKLPVGFGQISDILNAIARDLRGPFHKCKAIFFFKRACPRTKELLFGRSDRTKLSREELFASLDAAAKKFLENQEIMSALRRAMNFRFVAMIDTNEGK